MKIELELPDYERRGLSYSWDEDFEIFVNYDKKYQTVNIIANTEGLISLARHILTLAQPEVPVGFHHHYDNMNSPDSELCNLIIMKK